MRRLIRAVPAVVFAFVLFGAATAHAQPPKPDPTTRDVLLRQWTEIGEKVVRLAEEFPEDKYEFRPVPGVRTFASKVYKSAAQKTATLATWRPCASRGLPIPPSTTHRSVWRMPGHVAATWIPGWHGRDDQLGN